MTENDAGASFSDQQVKNLIQIVKVVKETSNLFENVVKKEEKEVYIHLTTNHHCLLILEKCRACTKWPEC